MLSAKTLFLFLFVCMTTVHAQPPWAGRPLTKVVTDIEGNEKHLHLQFDTLKKRSGHEGSKLYFTDRTWYNSNENNVGYGYADEQGTPAGLWKYYRQKGSGYELSCEGHYIKMTTDRLVVEEDVGKKFPAVAGVASKQEYINGLKDRFLFGGEWRFYKEGKLDKIIYLDDKAVIPYEWLMDADGTESIALADHYHQRLAGGLVAAVHFHMNGYISHIRAGSVAIEFNEEGKPIIPPIDDSIVLE